MYGERLEGNKPSVVVVLVTYIGDLKEEGKGEMELILSIEYHLRKLEFSLD